MTIPAGQTTATITLTPIEEMVAHANGTETATLTIATDPNDIYIGVLPNNQASMSIADTANEDGLVAEWKLDETSGTTASDSSGNGLNGTFQTSLASYSTGSGPKSVVAGEFNTNNNQYMDLATANSSTISILLGNGNGTFASATTLTPTYSPSQIAVGYFNGASNPLDLATFSSNGYVQIFLGNGDGTFMAETPYSVASTTATLAFVVADFNGDGYSDLAVSYYGISSGTVKVFLNNGNGGFGTGTSCTTGGMPESIIAADFNHDGITDLATANASSGTVSVFLGYGNGTFQLAKNVSVGNSSYSLAAGDFNGDGNLDLVTVNNSGNSVSIFLGNGNGTFSSAVSYTVGSGPRSVVVGDFNGDGKLDLATANYSANSISVLLGNGNGTFAAKTDYNLGSERHSPVRHCHEHLRARDATGHSDEQLRRQHRRGAFVPELEHRRSQRRLDSPLGQQPVRLCAQQLRLQFRRRRVHAFGLGEADGLHRQQRGHLHYPCPRPEYGQLFPVRAERRRRQ